MRRFLLSLIVQLRLALQRETYLCQLTKGVIYSFKGEGEDVT
jgi:hypothetical protein